MPLHEAAVGTENLEAVGCHSLRDRAAVLALPLERSRIEESVAPGARTVPVGCGLCPLPWSRERGHHFLRSGYRQKGISHRGKGGAGAETAQEGKNQGRKHPNGVYASKRAKIGVFRSILKIGNSAFWSKKLAYGTEFAPAARNCL